MTKHHHGNFRSGVFLTFSGNCKKALSFYQTCFGGTLQLETFQEEIPGYIEMPVVSGSLVSERIIIHGSDLVQDEGRIVGNYISIFLHCNSIFDRTDLIEKLLNENNKPFARDDKEQKLIELTDTFGVRWVLSI